MAYYDDLNNKKIVAIGVWGSLITFVIVILLQAAYYQQTYINDVRKASEYPQTVEMLEKQEQELEGYKWIDKDKGIIAIPIEKAKEEVIKELQQQAAPKTASLSQ